MPSFFVPQLTLLVAAAVTLAALFAPGVPLVDHVLTSALGWPIFGAQGEGSTGLAAAAVLAGVALLWPMIVARVQDSPALPFMPTLTASMLAVLRMTPVDAAIVTAGGWAVEMGMAAWQGRFGHARRKTDRRARSGSRGSAEPIEHLLDGVITLSADGTIVTTNPAARRLLGDAIVGRPIGRYLELLRNPNALADLASAAAFTEAEAILESAQLAPVELSVVAEPASGGYILRLTDITQRREKIAEIERLALHDALTGLPNRLLLHDRLDHALRLAEREDAVFAVMLLDLDKFKQVNDTLGHHVGDMLLQQVGPRLARSLRRSDTLARLGGDEFAVLLPGPTSHETACIVAERMVQDLVEPFVIDGMRLELGVSIGVACFPTHGSSRDTLLQQADAAMYRAKREKLGYVLCDDHQPESSLRRLGLRRSLGSAINAGQMQLVYQPKVHATSQQLNGVEAFLRWAHPDFGLLEPQDFLPMAEQTGHLQQLTLWIMNTCLREQRRWRQFGIDLPISINLSSSALRISEFPRLLRLSLTHWETRPERVILEIPESAIMADVDYTVPVLKAIAAMGCQIALDDFGSGYSSLVHLQRLPVHELKIHRQFLLGMEGDEGNATVIKAIIRLAHSLGLRVVATGVETEATARWLGVVHCDELQGFLYGRPVSGDELLPMITTGRVSARVLDHA